MLYKRTHPQTENDASIPPSVNLPCSVNSGAVRLSPSHRTERAEYDIVIMRPGRVFRADGELSNWLIPADVIRAHAPMFDGVASYLDHPEFFGFGWRGEPQVRNLIGVTFDVAWSEAEQALVGGLRLYDSPPDSPGAFVASLLNQMLADKHQGLEVPPIGLSAVFFHNSELDEETGLRTTTEFRKVESVDVVYSAGAGGYVRRALSAFWGGPASQIGIQRRDVLFQLGRWYVTDLDTLGSILEDVQPGDALRIGIIRGQVRAWAAIRARKPPARKGPTQKLRI